MFIQSTLMVQLLLTSFLTKQQLVRLGGGGGGVDGLSEETGWLG